MARLSRIEASKRDAGIIGVAAQTMQTVHVKDVCNDSYFNPAIDRPHGVPCVTILCQPVKGGAEGGGAARTLCGVIHCVNKRGNTGEFTEDDEVNLRGFAEQCAPFFREAIAGQVRHDI